MEQVWSHADHVQCIRAPSLGPGAVSWKLHREVALLAGWGRAILLQLAHPLVAQGVADHSAFLSEPHGHVRRLRRTLASMLALTFGSDDEARDAAARINAIHDRVHGHLPGTHGTHAAGARYSAHDPISSRGSTPPCSTRSS